MTDDSTRLAVLIDADNTSAEADQGDVRGARRATAPSPSSARTATGPTPQPQRLEATSCLGNAISAACSSSRTPTGKNATDSALIIDAMDLLYSGNVDGFAIVSSDSDFTPLATRLRESGKRVIGVGQRKTPEGVRRGVREVRVPRGPRRRRTCARDDRASATEPAKDDQPRPIQSVLTKALNKVDTDDDDWASLSALGNHLNRTDPSFDPRSYGFGKLSDLVKAQPFVETKTVTAPDGSEILWVRLKRRRPTVQASTNQPAEKATKKAAKKAAKKSAKNRRVSGWRRARPAALPQR